MASPWIGSNTSLTTSTEDCDAMPHVIVKLSPGKSEQQKRRLAKAITDDVMKVLQYGEESCLSRSRKSTRTTGPTGCISRTSYERPTPSTRNPATRCDGDGESLKRRTKEKV
jgi:hypothetical protein